MSRALVAPIVALTLALAACSVRPPALPRPAPTAAEQTALAGPPGATPVPLRVVVPAEGAVVPWPFPMLEIRWEDDFAANAFQVRVRTGQGAPILDAFTTERRLALSPDEIADLKARAGEGGAFEVEVIGASLLPSGRMLRGPSTALARARFSAAGEHPTGAVYYSAQIRPIGAPPGPSDRSHRLLIPRRVTLDGADEHILRGFFDKWVLPDGYPWKEEKQVTYAELGVPEWTTRREENVATRSLDFTGVPPRKDGRAIWADLFVKPQGPCMGCHVNASADGAYVAFMAALDDRRPGKGGDTFQTLFVVRTADRELLVEQRFGFFGRFHPTAAHLLNYTQWANEFKDGHMASIFRSDVHVVDLRTGADTLMPGAAEPDRCEMGAEWSPDGQWLVFSRAPVGEPCDGDRGHLEIVRVPWNDGKGGPSQVLVEVPEGGGANVRPRYSPDGRWIVFYRTPHGFYSKGFADLWIVAAEGGPARRLEVSTDAMESLQAFSPDGRWLAFQSNRERVDKVRGYVARFYDDGRTAPAVPLPGAGAPDVGIATLDWGR
jgi:hypothetical protein